METKIKYSCVGAGVLRGSVFTLAALLIYSAAIMVVPENLKAKSVIFMVITCFSVLYGAAYAAKKAGAKGWLIGLLVAAIYCVLIYVISLISGGSPVMGVVGIARIVIALFIGTLSGMLGINL